jgi:hemin uptake protein HemP
MEHEQNPIPPQTFVGETHAATPLPEFDSAELLQGRNEVLIRHAGEIYRLRLTRNDKLILQK